MKKAATLNIRGAALTRYVYAGLIQKNSYNLWPN